eukprot:TRINITY_DN11011_c0_g1_i1.p1 TRINITY_DN11011_c0_g1~~TRINITY_DN11011_c0_g1_i1.p1  ORF type:complete len:620 (+),score=160.98 TRINITY_DN11011_c0_g1_i1:153-1862(+)
MQEAVHPSGPADVSHAAFLKRSVGQLESSKATLESELHHAVSERDLLSGDLESLRTLCHQLEAQVADKTRANAELEAEVSLINNLLTNNQRKAGDEIAKLSNDLESAIRRRSAAETELSALRTESTAAAVVQSTLPLVSAEETEAYKQRSKDLQDLLTRSREKESETQRLLDQERRQLQEAQTNVERLLRRSEDTQTDTTRYTDLLSNLWAAAAPAAGLKHPAAGHLPTMAEVMQCASLLSTVHLGKSEELRKHNQRLQHDVDRLEREVVLTKDEGMLARSNHEARAQSHEASLKMARDMVEDYKVQVSKVVGELETVKTGRDQLLREYHSLQAALEVAGDQLDTVKREKDSSVKEVRDRSVEMQNELLAERGRYETLHSEYELLLKRGDDEISSSQFKRRQMSEQLSYLEAQLMRARSDAEVSHQEFKTCAAERDYLKLEQSNLKEQLQILENEVTTLRQSLALCEQGRERDIEAHAMAQGDLNHRRKLLEEENSRLRATESERHTSDQSARRRLATAPVGSTVVVEQNVGNVKPPLIGLKGIVIAHAVSPDGDPGALVGVCIRQGMS